MTSNMQAFLQAIRVAEGTAGPDGYRTLFGGELFTSFRDHPRLYISRMSNGHPITSSAAGAYQFLEKTWDDVNRVLHLPDFSPNSQDEAAVELIRRRGAMGTVNDGHFNDAIEKVRKEWASLPNAGYGQPEQSLERLRLAYEDAGGSFA